MPSKNYEEEEHSDYENCISERVLSQWKHLGAKELKRHKLEHKLKARMLFKTLSEQLKATNKKPKKHVSRKHL
jgi:hypothetical protein